MKNIMIILVLSILTAVTFMGCAVVEKTDGSKGLVFGLTPEQHETIGNVGETATGIFGALSQFYAPLGAAAVAAGAGTAVWKGKKLRKTIVRKEQEVAKNRAPLRMLVQALEAVKTDVTDDATWDKVRTRIKEQYPDLEVENTIRQIKAEIAKS
jgi:hypothetical protein